MLNLVIKDLKITLQQVWLICALWLFMLINSAGKGFPFMAISLILVFQPLLIDDKNKMEKTYISFPVNRKDVVLARFIAGVFLMLFNIGITYLGGLVIHVIFPAYFKTIIPIGSIIGPQVVIMFGMVLVYPIFFKFGNYLDAGMKVVAIVLTSAIVLAFGALIILNYNNIDLFAIENILLYSSITALTLLFLSMLLSLRIYRLREF